MIGLIRAGTLLLFLWPSTVLAQQLPLEKQARRARNAISLERIDARGIDPATVTRIALPNYSDTVFPCKDLLRFRNLQSVWVSGVPVFLKKNDDRLPIRLEIDTGALRQLPALRYIEFEFFDFSTFPSTFFGMRDLHGLSMTGCLIDSLPTAIAEMKELKYLGLRLNHLASLPTSLAKLDSLRFLDLNNNHFLRLPDVLVEMPSLQKLFLGNAEGNEERADLGFGYHAPLCINHFDWEVDTSGFAALLRRPNLSVVHIPRDECSDRLYLLRAFPGKPFANKVSWDPKPQPCPDLWPDRAWRRFPVPDRELIEHGKCLCGLKGL